jgi:hypothetical protein
VTPQSGAGIAALQGMPGVKQGDVFLFAPHGTVDAGDAGVRANVVVVGALRVLNADNIQANRSIGLPTVPTTNTAALAADNTAAAATKAMESPKAGNSDHGKESHREPAGGNAGTAVDMEPSTSGTVPSVRSSRRNLRSRHSHAKLGSHGNHDNHRNLGNPEQQRLAACC